MHVAAQMGLSDGARMAKWHYAFLAELEQITDEILTQHSSGPSGTRIRTHQDHRSSLRPTGTRHDSRESGRQLHLLQPLSIRLHLLAGYDLDGSELYSNVDLGCQESHDQRQQT